MQAASNFSNNNHDFEEQEVRLSDYWRIIYRGKWIIILSFLIVVAATAYYSFTTPPTYEASCMVMVDQTGGMTQTLFDISPFGGKQVTMMNNQVQILKSQRLAREVVTNLLRDGYKDSLKLFYVEEKNAEPVNYLRLGVKRLQGALTVDPIRDTDIIKINVKAGSAYEAAFLANRVAKTFQELDRQFSRGEISQVVSFLDDQLKKKEKDLRESEDALRAYQQSSGVFALPDETKELVTQLVDFESQLATARTDLEANKRRLEFLKSQLGQMRTDVENGLKNISTPLISQLKQKIAENEATLTALEIQKSKSPVQYDQINELKKSIRVMKRQLNGEIKKLFASKTPIRDSLEPYWDVVQKVVDLETENLALKAQVSELQKIVKKYTSKMETLPDKSLKLARLERAKTLNENIYLMMKQKYEESRVTEAGQIGKIRIIDQAI
ncbi:MAG: GumC family protein, partial [Calditrichaeota bacterium]|nr:GumC family protein [Calditrichota bacterium]